MPTQPPSNGYFGKATHPGIIVAHDVIRAATSLCLGQASCPGCLPSQPLAHPKPTPWGSRARNRAGLKAA